MTDVVPSATDYEPEPIEEDADEAGGALPAPTKPPEGAGDAAI